MKKSILILAMVVGGVGTLAAADQQVRLDVDGTYGVETAPTSVSSDPQYGGLAGVEYDLSPAMWGGSGVGVAATYNYLEVGKSPVTNQDNDVDLAVRYLAPSLGMFNLYLQVGGGVNVTGSSKQLDVDGHYVGFVGPGVRIAVCQAVDIDFGVQYGVTTPQADYRQSVGAVLGVSVPLWPFLGSSDKAAEAPAAASSTSSN